MQDEQSLIDLCKAPGGYRFRRGFWATHDLNLSALADWIAPALSGSDSTDRHRRRLESRDFACEGLFVFHAADRLTPGASLPPWVYPVPAGGRRLHAKFALLQYGSKSGKKTVTRAVVASANLTESGLSRNREIVVWEDVGNKAKKAGLASSLLSLFRVLAAEWQAERKSDDARRAIQILEDISGMAGGGPDPSLFCETVTKKNDLLADLPFPAPARRILVVTPPFAAEGDPVSPEGFRRFVGPDTTIDLYVGRRITATVVSEAAPVAFSRKALNALKKQAKEVHLFAVPEFVPDEDGNTVARTLHAKMISLEKDDGKCLVLAGSANYTTRGLGGANREMMVGRWMSAEERDKMIEPLQAIPFTGEPSKPKQTEPEGDPRVSPDVQAEFEIDQGQSPKDRKWEGTLRLTGEGVEKFRYLDKTYPWRAEQKITLQEDRMFIEVRADGKWWPIPVILRAPEENFWTDIGPEDPRPPDPDLELYRLLFDVERTRRLITPPPPPPPGKKKQNDGYRIPLDQRLVVLARKREAIWEYLPPEECEKLLTQYLKPEKTPGKEAAGVDEAELACALAILGRYIRLPQEPRDPLLRALKEALPSFDAKREEKQG